MFKNLMSIALIIVPSFYFGQMGKPTEMGLAIIAGSMGAAFINLDKFTKIKGAGFEAELKRAVDKAYATIDSLKKVASTLCSFTITELVFGDRIYGSGLIRKTEHLNEITELTKELDVFNEEHEKLIEVFHKFQTRDLLVNIISYISNQNGPVDLIEELEKIAEPNHEFPSRKELIKLFDKYNIEVEGELEKIINRYVYYLKNREPKYND